MENRTTPNFITELKNNQIFVFGSNKDGLHYGGAAKIAHEKFGAEWGKGMGLYGKSYAIDTMSGFNELQRQVEYFITDALDNPDKIFLVTEIGCGIAGYSPEEIAPLFKEVELFENIHLPTSFWKVLNTKN